MAISIQLASTAELKLAREIAYESWPNAYGHILTDEQLQHMLSLFYNDEALANQQQIQGHQFIIARDENDQHIGFASYSIIATEKEIIKYKLHKLYVLTTQQQSGCGKAMIAFIEEQIRKNGAQYLRLNVNRYNEAITFYKKMGFEIISEEDIDIGNGYFMNDYVMEKKIAAD